MHRSKTNHNRFDEKNIPGSRVFHEKGLTENFTSKYYIQISDPCENLNRVFHKIAQIDNNGNIDTTGVTT